MLSWQQLQVRPTATLFETIGVIDRGAAQVALVTDASGKLLGIMTDGDVRRAILAGHPLEGPISDLYNPNPRALPYTTSRSAIFEALHRNSFMHMPLVDEQGRVVGLAHVSHPETMGVLLANPVLLMAGGLGTRLSPLTDSCPKPMLKVGDRPILETILLQFIQQGFHQFYFSVNYLANVIIDHFGDGSKWGVSIKYLHEQERRGTAGALSLIKDPILHPMIVMNGDILTKADFTEILEFHTQKQAVATMAVREYEFTIPYGVVVSDPQEFIRELSEKPTYRYAVNAGIYCLSPEGLVDLPASEYYDMPTLFDRFVSSNKTCCSYLLRSYWMDIGQKADFQKANQEYAVYFGN